MRIPDGYQMANNVFIICQEKAEVVRMIFDYYPFRSQPWQSCRHAFREKDYFPNRKRTLDKSSNR